MLLVFFPFNWDKEVLVSPHHVNVDAVMIADTQS